MISSVVHTGFIGKVFGASSCFLLQELYCQHKKQKFIEYQTFPGCEKLLHIFRKMNSPDRIISICELIAFPYLLRQIFPMERPCIQNLMDQLRDHLVGKSFRQTIYRLHTVNDFLISCRGKKSPDVPSADGLFF